MDLSRFRAVVVWKPKHPKRHNFTGGGRGGGGNSQDSALLNAYRPNYWTSAGLRTATLDRVEVRNGRAVGFYSIVVRNPQTGLRERMAWRYGVRRGVVVLEKTYPGSVV